MPAIALASWAPDSASVDSSVTANVENAFPRARGYGPVPSLSTASLSLPGPCRGAVDVSIDEATPIYFAGTATKLYRFDPVSTGWVDVSKPGSTYSVPADDYWSFERFGSQVVAVHVNAPVQVFDIRTDTTFSDLAGSPPRARFCGVTNDVLVLGGLVDEPTGIAWSAINDITNWQFGTSAGVGSDVQVFPDGGAVMGFAAGDLGLVFQRRSIRRMVPTGDAGNLFSFSRVEEERGAISPWSIIKSGGNVFFLATDGFYQFATGASSPIGAQICNEYFATIADASALGRALGVVDQTGPRVMWAFKSGLGADPTVLDRAIVYDWFLKQWTVIVCPARYWMRGVTLAKSIDQITQPLDTLPASLDSAIFAGGIPYTAAFTPDDKLAFMGGPPLAAVLETADAQVARPNRAFVRGVRLDSDADGYAVAVGGREDLARPVVFKPPTKRAPTGFCPARVSARYHRARVTIPAWTMWTFATAIEPDAVPEGMR